MPIKLLPKSEIAKRKADARRMDIDEGVKVAKRVDNLRQVAAEEEASLSRFRKEQVIKIHAEVNKENEVLTSLKREVRALEDKRKELLKPLDHEWEAITREKELIEITQHDLTKEDKALKKREEQLRKEIKEAAACSDRANTKEYRANDLLREAAEAKKQAEVSLINAREAEQAAYYLEDRMRAELHDRDIEMASRERDFYMKERSLSESAAELEKEWKLLKDRKEAFSRQIKRINKK